MPAGIYTLSVTASTNTATTTALVNFSYPDYSIGSSGYTEFFYEGFEEYQGAVTTGSHTGIASYSGSYTVPFTLPNSRSYLLEWWSFSSGIWSFHEQSYTGPIALSGQIDDVRVFPADAQMITSTFAPMVGKTSTLDTAGFAEYTQYDGLNRQNLVLDNDLNIKKAMDYGYKQAIGRYTVTLQNSTTYPAGIVTATIDNVAYSFPAPNASTQIAVTLPAGIHTIQLAYGPSNCYVINGTSYTASQTNPAISVTVAANLNIDYVSTCTTTSSQTGNLTTDVTNTNAYSCTGCQYTTTVYFSGSVIGVGTQLYTDTGLTQKVTGKTWFVSYTNSGYSWLLSSTGVVSGSASPCP